VETDMTGVEQVSADGIDVVSRYSLDGRQLTSPAKGLNIVRMKDGAVRKVLLSAEGKRGVLFCRMNAFEMPCRSFFPAIHFVLFCNLIDFALQFNLYCYAI